VPVTNYEKVDVYPIDPEEQEKILQEQNECVFCWGTRDHWPVGMIMSYVWRDGRFWLTATSLRKRVAALKRDDRVSISVSSVGTSLGPAKGITIKGRCVIRDDRQTKDWFYAALAEAIVPGHAKGQRAFAAMLDSPNRVVFEVKPEKFFTFDSVKMMEDSLFPKEP
jgi:general stress protein 26